MNGVGSCPTDTYIRDRLVALRVADIPGWMAQAELAWLCLMGHRWTHGPSGAWVEVGSYRGRSTCAVLAGFPWGLSPWTVTHPLWCVDTFDGRDTPTGDITTPAEGAAAFCETFRDRQLPLPRILPMPSTVAAQFIEQASVVFIDGAHDAAHVSEDIAAWLPKVHRGGVICGHDYPAYGVGPVVDATFGTRVQRGPASIWYVEV